MSRLSDVIDRLAATIEARRGADRFWPLLASR